MTSPDDMRDEDIGNPIYTRLATQTNITDAQAAFCRLACGTDEVSTALRHNRIGGS